MLEVQKHLYCYGLGYCAQHLVDELDRSAWQVSHSVREGFASLKLPENITHVLISIPPQDGVDIVLQHHLQALQALPNLQWVGYLSSTVVYGDHDGAWVDETAALRSITVRGKARIKAEQAWMDSGLPVNVFRLSGIYGPGRNALLQLQRGTAKRIYKENHVFSRIHVADIVAMLQASIAHEEAGEIYNVADDMPAAQHEVVAYAAELLGIDPPPLVPFEKAELSPMAASFYQDSRKINNRKLKALLPELRYPDYKIGLDSIVTRLMH